MARSITVIHDEIMATIWNDSTLAGVLVSPSLVAIYRLFAYVVAVCIYSLEILFDNHKAEITALIASQKPHTKSWYREKSLAFQYGATLPEYSDSYDNSGISQTVIDNQKIIKAAAIVEGAGLLLVKVTGENNGDFQPLTTPQYNAFIDYMSKIKDAGARMNIINFQPDKLRLTIDIYYNPQTLNAQGERIDGTSATPVQDAIKLYLKNMPFDGVFVKSYLVDALQKVPGVIVPEIRAAQATKYDVQQWSSIDINYSPFSGFLRIYDPSDLVLNFVPYV